MLKMLDVKMVISPITTSRKLYVRSYLPSIVRIMGMASQQHCP